MWPDILQLNQYSYKINQFSRYEYYAYLAFLRASNIYIINLVQIHARGHGFGHEHGELTGFKGSNTNECTLCIPFSMFKDLILQIHYVRINNNFDLKSCAARCFWLPYFLRMHHLFLGLT